MFASEGVALVEAVTRCALPGCDVLIEDIPGRPVRRYCSAAHRAAARQARRASAHDEQDARLAATLPWLREHAGREPDQDPQVGPSAVTHAPADRSHPFQAGSPLPTESPLPIEPRLQTELPLPIEPPLPAASPSPSASPLPAASLRQAGQPLPAASPQNASVALDPTPRAPELASAGRWRALAVLSAAVVLIGTYAVTVAEPVAPSETPVQAAPKGETHVAWAIRARLGLTSINRQLDTIAQTEEAWSQLPNQAAAPVAPVDALMERKVLLLRRQAALRSQLGVYDAVRGAQKQLELSEQQLRAVESALHDVPPQAQRSPVQAGETALLIDQRDVHIRQRDARRQELANLQNGVQAAALTSLPDDGHETDRVTGEVLDIIRGGRGEQPSNDSAVEPPEVIGGREEQDGRPRQDVANSAPPDPRGPRDEPGPRQRERGPVLPVAHTLDVLDGADTESAERGRAEGREMGSGTRSQGGDSAVDSLPVSRSRVSSVPPTASGRAVLGMAAAALAPSLEWSAGGSAGVSDPDTPAVGGSTGGFMQSMVAPWSESLGSGSVDSSDWQRSSTEDSGSGSTDSDDDRDEVSDMDSASAHDMAAVFDMGSISDLASSRGGGGWGGYSGGGGWAGSGDSDEDSDDSSDSD